MQFLSTLALLGFLATALATPSNPALKRADDLTCCHKGDKSRAITPTRQDAIDSNIAKLHSLQKWYLVPPHNIFRFACSKQTEISVVSEWDKQHYISPGTVANLAMDIRNQCNTQDNSGGNNICGRKWSSDGTFHVYISHNSPECTEDHSLAK